MKLRRLFVFIEFGRPLLRIMWRDYACYYIPLRDRKAGSRQAGDTSEQNLYE